MKAKEKIQNWMKMYAPPGIAISQEASYWMMTMGIATIWCLQFLLRYWDNLSSLYEINGSRKIVIEGAMMPAFWDLTYNLFEVFYLVILFCGVMIVYHYYYHYQGSRMMYLMRRLPNRWELHIRCLALPMIAAVLAMIYMLVLKILFYAIYIFCTPSQCLPLLYVQ